MVFINPWAYYQIHEPDKIPDLNPHDDEEVRGCLAGACGFIIASIIFALVTYLLFSIKVSGYINRYCLLLLMLVNGAVIYPTLTILLMKLSFKIADKFIIKKIMAMKIVFEEATMTRTFNCGENGIVGYLHHKPTHNKIAVYQHIGWFQRLMIRWCFGLEYEVK